MVEQRTREIGIRMALGADRAAVISMVMRKALLLMALGAAAGVCIALWSNRNRYYGVMPKIHSLYAGRQTNQDKTFEDPFCWPRGDLRDNYSIALIPTTQRVRSLQTYRDDPSQGAQNIQAPISNHR
jgi:hypothetical protein